LTTGAAMAGKKKGIKTVPRRAFESALRTNEGVQQMKEQWLANATDDSNKPDDLRELEEREGDKSHELALMLNATVENRREAVEEKDRLRRVAGGRLKVCGAEGCSDDGRKRCLGCYATFYCTKACQEAAWGSHTVECRTTRAQFDTIVLTKDFMKPEDPLIEFFNNMTEGHCIVQVVDDGHRTDRLMVASENRSIIGFLRRAGQEAAFDKVTRAVQERGFKGRAGFFIAIMKSNKKNKMKIEVNSEKMLPPEGWVNLSSG